MTLASILGLFHLKLQYNVYGCNINRIYIKLRCTVLNYVIKYNTTSMVLDGCIMTLLIKLDFVA